jgi:hypothetical protein
VSRSTTASEVMRAGDALSTARTAMLAGAIDATTKLAYPVQNGHFFSGATGAPGAVAPFWTSLWTSLWQGTGAKRAILLAIPEPAAMADMA